MEDIDFLFDDTHLEKAELEKIARQAGKEPVKKDFNAVILRKFTIALINAVIEQKNKEAKTKAVEIKPIQQKPTIKEAIGEVPHPEIAEEIKKEKLLTEEKKIPVSPIEPPKPEFPEYIIIKNTESKAMASVQIKNHNYFLKEPELNDKDKQLLKILIDKFEKDILKKPDLVNNKNFMIKIIQKYSNKLKIPFTPDYFDNIRYYLIRDVLGYSSIDPLMQDIHVKEIHFMGLHKPLHIVFNDERDIETNVMFGDMQDVNKLVKKFFDKAKIKLSKDNNYLDNDAIGFQLKAFYDFNLKESKFDIKK